MDAQLNVLYDVFVVTFIFFILGEQTSLCTTEQSRQTLNRQPSSHSAISGHGKVYKQTEARTQPSGKPILNDVGKAATKLFHLSDVSERRTSFHTHFPPVSEVVIVFGRSCLMRFGA